MQEHRVCKSSRKAT